MAPRQGTAPAPGTLPISYDVPSQFGHLTGQLYSAWTECHHIQSQNRSLQAQLSFLQQENAKLRQDLNIEAQQYSRTSTELFRLREQVQRLEDLLSRDGEKSAATVSTFFQLEARDLSLQQAENELCQTVTSLRMRCQEIENRYAVKSRDRRLPPFCDQPRQTRQYKLPPIGTQKGQDVSGGN
ncbi:hypothetical protein BDV59DRAFT_206477 [Aspergillus ambiguus]|uniref:uncharacterized protein n=1 Tax=Aspergillus ambiguus TaxID=176160 RepID=UPI003CCD0993